MIDIIYVLFYIHAHGIFIQKTKLMNYSSLADIDMTQADIDADAATILRSATETVAAILGRREKLDREGQQNDPLVVLAGESHSMPAHHLHHMLVLDGLTKSGEEIVFGCEQPHNLLSDTFFNITKLRPAPAIETFLKESDQDGKLTLQCWSSFYKSGFTDHTQNTLFRYLRRNDQIKVCFTDAARQGHYLDSDDQSTADSMKECLSNDRHLSSPDGTQARNHHITPAITDFALKHNARIAIQQCGDDHVIGNEHRNHKAKNSIAAYLKRQNTPILAMPILCKLFNESSIPADHGLTKEEQLFRIDLPQKEAVYNPLTDEPVPNYPADFECHAAEAVYINALLERTELKNERMSVKGYWAQKQALQNDMIEKFQAWHRVLTPMVL